MPKLANTIVIWPAVRLSFWNTRLCSSKARIDVHTADASMASISGQPNDKGPKVAPSASPNSVENPVKISAK